MSGGDFPGVCLAWTFLTRFTAPAFAREWHEQDNERRRRSNWWLHTEAVVRREPLEKCGMFSGSTPAPELGHGSATTSTPPCTPSPAHSDRSLAAKPDETKRPPPLVLNLPPASLFSPAPSAAAPA